MKKYANAREVNAYIKSLEDRIKELTQAQSASIRQNEFVGITAVDGKVHLGQAQSEPPEFKSILRMIHERGDNPYCGFEEILCEMLAEALEREQKAQSARVPEGMMVPRELLEDLYRYGTIRPIEGVVYNQPHSICLERAALLLAAAPAHGEKEWE